MKNWSEFNKRIIINKAKDSIYRSWATKSELQTWFLETAEFESSKGKRNPNDLIQKGDCFTWKWNNWDFHEEGKVLDANGNDFISFTFGDTGNVDVKLTSVNGETEVVLRQYNIPTDEQAKMDYFVGCNTGWTFWLANLKAYLEYGITLHAKGLKQEETKDLVNS